MVGSCGAPCESRRFSVGESPTRELGAPPGSNRSGGGNESVEAFDVEGHVCDLASMQAGTRVNVEQAEEPLIS